VRSGSLTRDDELLAHLQAPPDLHDGIESLAYWRGRRQRLAWYRRRAKREAARMIVVWERRVGAALVQQRQVPFAARLRAARLLAGGRLQRWGFRAGVGVAATAFILFVLAPALLVLELLLKAQHLVF
jgi:hypothetical protein